MTSTKRSWGRLRQRLLRRFPARAMLLCVMALAPGAIFVFAQLPPLWRDYDSLAQIAREPGHINLLQFPALYPALSRIPVLAVSAFQWAFGEESMHVDPSARVALNDAGVLLLVAGQQLALVVSLALLILEAAESLWRRVALVLLALATPVLFLSAQLVSSEALGVIMMVLLLVLALRLLQSHRAQDGRTLLLFGVVLYLNIMTRHVSALFAALLPLGYGFAFAAALGKRLLPAPRYWWRKLRLSLFVGLAAIFLAQATTILLCAIFREPYRSVVSRTAIYRLDAIDRLPPAARAACIRELQERTDDPLLKEAIPRLLEVKGYWGGSLAELNRLIQQRYPEMPKKQRRKLADAYLTKICLLYYQAMPPVLIARFTSALRRALLQATPEHVGQFFLKIGVVSLQLYRGQERLAAQTRHLEICSPAAEARIVSFAGGNWTGRGLNKIPCGLVLLASAIAASLLAWFKQFPSGSLLALWALVATNLLLMIGTFAISGYSARQVLPECIFAFAAVALLVGRSAEGLGRARQSSRSISLPAARPPGPASQPPRYTTA